jgi:beta-glucosidase
MNEPKSDKKNIAFPANFLWGTSTSAHQVEGGNSNDWSEWEGSDARCKKLEEEGRNISDYTSGQACDSYNRYEEDFDLCLGLHNNAHRLSIEWSRIEPEEGKFDQKEIEHYRQVLLALKKRGLKTFVTLWWWTNPLWLQDAGGWEDKKIIFYFSRYVELIARELGEHIDFWMTLNEPLMIVGHGHLDGKFPPNKKKDFIGAIKLGMNFLRAHKAAYKKIRETIPQAKIGIVMSTGYFSMAHRYNPIEWLIVRLGSYFRNFWLLNRLKSYFDFIGVNYYHHDRIIWHPPFKKNLNKEITDFGWEIYPKGIYHVLMGYKKYGKPIYVTENGIADEDDDQRTRFIIDHLKYIHQAIAEGTDVRGYFYWSLLDNFEWADGYEMKFGLFKVDRQTFVRSPQPSAKVYAEICRNNGIIN